MSIVYHTVMKALPKFVPTHNKKCARVQQKRREQLKHIMADMSRIAVKEIERFNEFTQELLTQEADNPIILDQDDAEEKKEE